MAASYRPSIIGKAGGSRRGRLSMDCSTGRGRSGTASCGIAVMAKASAPGRTKTRLVPPLTPDEAADFNTAFLQDVVHNIAQAQELQSVAGYAAYSPADSRAFFEGALPPPIGLFDCCYADFGDCLFNAVVHL